MNKGEGSRPLPQNNLLSRWWPKVIRDDMIVGIDSHDEPKEDNIKRDISRLFQTLPVKNVKK